MKNTWKLHKFKFTAPIPHLFPSYHHYSGNRKQMKPVQKQIFKRNFYEETQKVNPMRKHMTTQSESDGPIHYIRMLLAAQTHPLANTSSLISHCVHIVIFQYLQLSFPCMEVRSYKMHCIDDISANCVQYILQIAFSDSFHFTFFPHCLW